MSKINSVDLTPSNKILAQYMKEERAANLEERRKTRWTSRLPSHHKRFPLEAIMSELTPELSTAINSWLKADKVTNLLLIGDVGVGKTTAAITLCDTLWEQKKMVPMFTKYQHLFNIRLGKTDDTGKEWKRVLNSELLVVDDIIASHSTELSDWKHETLYELFDERYVNGLPTIITTNMTPDELKTLLGPRIIDRLRSNSVSVVITGESKR